MEVWICKQFVEKLKEHNNKNASDRECIFFDKTGTQLCVAEHGVIDWTTCLPCDVKKFVEATVPALTAALEELGYAVTIQQKCKACGSTTFCTCSGR